MLQAKTRIQVDLKGGIRHMGRLTADGRKIALSCTNLKTRAILCLKLDHTEMGLLARVRECMRAGLLSRLIMRRAGVSLRVEKYLGAGV